MVKAVYKNNGCGRKMSNVFQDNPCDSSQSRGRVLGSGNKMIKRESRLDRKLQHPNSTSGQKGTCSLSMDVELSFVFQGLTTTVSRFLQNKFLFLICDWHLLIPENINILPGYGILNDQSQFQLLPPPLNVIPFSFWY